MKDMHVYEMVTAKSDKEIEIGLLTENGLGNGIITAKLEGHDMVIESSKQAVRLKNISDTIKSLIRKGSSFHIINLEQDSVERVKVKYIS